MRLLLQSATPIYNSFKEIIGITNLLNINDKSSRINLKDVFDIHGNFHDSGRELLRKKLTGYVSYVREENPYTFPYRIYPDTFAPDKTFSSTNLRPTLQLNGEIIDSPISLIHPYLSRMHNYQEKCA